MNVELINPFIDSTVRVFGTMLGVKARRVGLSLVDRFQPEYDITGVIGLSGKASGDVVVSYERNVAIQATAALLGEMPTSIDESVIDTVGELANMIAGHAKASLERYDVRLALPTVITGRNHSIRFVSRVKPICIPFECPWGKFSIEVGVVIEDDEATDAPAPATARDTPPLRTSTGA